MAKSVQRRGKADGRQKQRQETQSTPSSKNKTNISDTGDQKAKYVMFSLGLCIILGLILQPYVSSFIGTLKSVQNEKTDETAEVKKSKPQPSSSNGQSISPKSQTQSSSKTSKAPSQDQLPDEVKNFKPTILDALVAKKIFADGRRIPPVELLHQKTTNSTVKVYLFNDFLSEAECDGLRKAHDSHVAAATVDPIVCFDSITTLRRHLKDAKKNIKVSPKDFTSGTTCLNESFSRDFKAFTKGNWSFSTAFYPGESKFSKVFEHHVEQATALKKENGGKFQITSYPLGVGYKKHTDCVVGSQEKRDRFATILVYLQDVEKGGETKFPELGIWVRPKKGRALVWTNMDAKGNCDPLSIHDAAIVEDGHKYILQRWYYYKSFYSLGKRPPEPPLPTRAPGTPRVTCDEYEQGSCRWYDEWNFEHVLEYERQKHILI
ncbi:prolyl 4-hydroxylase subunit alpha-1 [Lingula anatina]|uniref:Prolyl 4-hydroxylase subunit alpha-1 n=1 Tax=Lingula anatina TaxID=7574 RepID=A0A1S3KEF5_LINAN|nr:prolyl 4-hydroxylase subunit alpha-1 [Lingula anatina]|eukprot:XP_013420882.1 prolyl 4-hydroxylase subunit alpha-1 [Lingula anatina]